MVAGFVFHFGLKGADEILDPQFLLFCLQEFGDVDLTIPWVLYDVLFVLICDFNVKFVKDRENFFVRSFQRWTESLHGCLESLKTRCFLPDFSQDFVNFFNHNLSVHRTENVNRSRLARTHPVLTSCHLGMQLSHSLVLPEILGLLGIPSFLWLAEVNKRDWFILINVEQGKHFLTLSFS